MTNRTVALVPAAGRGLRMGSDVPKQFLTLGGLPILVHSLLALEGADSVGEVVLVVPAAERDYCLNEVVPRHGIAKVTRIVAGGPERQDSVRLGLETVRDEADLVLVHDAVRPFLTADLVARVLERASEWGAALVAVPIRDTVKQVGQDSLVERTVDRRGLWLAQTPQAFRVEVLREAHRKAHLERFRATDDAQLVEWLGRPAAIVEGSAENIKITRPEDLAIGESILARRHQGKASFVIRQSGGIVSNPFLPSTDDE